MDPIVSHLLISIYFWYIPTMAEGAINGARQVWYEPFNIWYNDVMGNVPFYGDRHRLKLTNNDQDWADMLPSIRYTIIMHFCIPFGWATYTWITQ